MWGCQLGKPLIDTKPDQSSRSVSNTYDENQQCEVEEGLTVPASAFWIVCITIFVDSLGGSISAPVLPFYAKSFHASNEDIGLLFSAFSLSQVIFLPVLGAISDRAGRRIVLVLSLFGAALGAWAQALAPTYLCFAAARVLSGAFAAVGSTANVYVSDITTLGIRGEYLGYLMSCNGAAFAFGPGLGGGLSSFGLNVPITINGVLCFVAGLLALAYLPESPVFMRQQQQELDAANAAAACPGDSTKKAYCFLQRFSFPRAVWAVCLVEFLRGFSFSAIFAMYGLFALKAYDLDSLHIGYAVMVGALTLLCTNIWITGRLQRRIGQVWAAALGMAIMAFGEIALAYTPHLGLSLLGMWAVYMGQAIAGASIAAVTSALSTDANRGSVMSMQQVAQALGRVVGPFILGRASDVDPRLPFAFAAAAVLVGGVTTGCMHGAYERQVDVFSEPVPSSSPPPSLPWAIEEYTPDDVQEMGSCLCELLAQGGYRWHEPEQRESLKKALRICFPPLKNITLDMDAGSLLRGQSRAFITEGTMDELLSGFNGASISITGDDARFQPAEPPSMRSRGHSLRSRAATQDFSRTASKETISWCFTPSPTPKPSPKFERAVYTRAGQ